MQLLRGEEYFEVLSNESLEDSILSLRKWGQPGAACLTLQLDKLMFLRPKKLQTFFSKEKKSQVGFFSGT